MTLVHELRHAKEFISLEKDCAAPPGIVRGTPYRQGVQVHAAERRIEEEGYHGHFKGLCEAIATEWDFRILSQALLHPLLAEESTWMESTQAGEIRKKLSREREIPEEYITWVSSDGESFDYTGYQWQHKVLRYVMECIAEDMKKDNPDIHIDDIFKYFNDAQYGNEPGAFLRLARVFESSFGNRSFRELGNMGTDNKSARLALENLRKMRTDVLRARKKNSKIT